MGIKAATQSATIVPTEQESQIAEASSRQLAPLVARKRALRIRVIDRDNNQPELVLPAAAVRLLMDLLSEMARGNAITIVPVHAELTTQQAADVLNVSRPFFIKLLEQGKIQFRKVGRHRRILFEHLAQYKKTIETKQKEALDELIKQAQELDLGY